jgi:hypothetical protein
VLLSTWAYLRARAESDHPEVRAWIEDRRSRVNRLLGATLAAGLPASLPAAWLHARGTLEPSRAALIAASGTAVLLVVGAAAFGRRFRGSEPTTDPEIARRGRGAYRWYTASFAAFVLGTLTKEIAAVLPGILLLVEVVVVHGSWRGGLAALKGRLFPFFAIPAFLILLRVAAYGYIASPDPIRSWDSNLLTQFEVVVDYFRLWVWPVPQSIHHDHAVVLSPGSPTTWLCGSLILGLIVAGTTSVRRAPAAAFGILLMLGALAPTSSVFALKETMVEHRTYLPTVGFAVLVGRLAASGPALLQGRLRPMAAAVAVWLVMLGGLHVRYDRQWMSEEELWRNAVTVNPDSSDAWRYLGDLYSAGGRWDDADKALREALRARPSNVEAQNKLGHSLAVRGRLDEAETHFRAAVAGNDCFAPGLNNLATLHRVRSDIDSAVELFARALTCDERSWIAHRGLADIYFVHLQDRNKAAHHYSMAIQYIDPLSPAAGEIKKRLMELSF